MVWKVNGLEELIFVNEQVLTPAIVFLLLKPQ